MSPARTVRATDATRLSFPLQLVILILSAFGAAYGAAWSHQAKTNAEIAKLSSDVRDILTRMEADRRVSETNAKLVDQNNAAMKESIGAISRRQELQQMQIAELKEQLLILTQGRK